MRYAIWFLCVCFLVRPVLAAEPIVFDMGKMKIGDKLTEEFAYSHCPAKDKGKAEIKCHKFINMYGGDVFVMYYFDEFKLVGVTLSYKPSMFGDLISAYTNKFGQPPHETKEESVITKAGVEYINEIKSWNTDSGEFIVEKYGSSISEGYAYIRSPEYESYLLKKQAERQQKLGGEL